MERINAFFSPFSFFSFHGYVHVVRLHMDSCVGAFGGLKLITEIFHLIL